MSNERKGEKLIKKGEWFYDYRTQTLWKWTKDQPLVYTKGRGLDQVKTHGGDSR